VLRTNPAFGRTSAIQTRYAKFWGGGIFNAREVLDTSLSKGPVMLDYRKCAGFTLMPVVSTDRMTIRQ